MGRAARRSLSTLFVAAALSGGAACVDLFHATDFELCKTDPETGACAIDAGADATSATSDATIDSGDSPIELCQQEPRQARAIAERTCARLRACEGSFDGQALGSCIFHAQGVLDCAIVPGTELYGAMADYWRCLVNAKTCDDIDTCIFHGPPPTCITEDGSPNAFTQCMRGFGDDESSPPSIRVECAEDSKRPRAVESCAATAQTCTVGNDGVARCTGKLGASGCPSPSKCDGSYLVSCVDGDPVDHGQDCSQSGARECVEDDGGARCAAEDVDVCLRGSILCDDGVAYVACKDGTSRTFDCGALGMECDDKPTATKMFFQSACRSKSSKLCDPSEQPDTCEDGDVSTCTYFERRRISCRELGLGPCTTDHPSCTSP